MAKRKKKASRLSKVDKQQKTQINYIEGLGNSIPSINNVPVVRALTYEIMQILNGRINNDSH